MLSGAGVVILFRAQENYKKILAVISKKMEYADFYPSAYSIFIFDQILYK